MAFKAGLLRHGSPGISWTTRISSSSFAERRLQRNRMAAAQPGRGADRSQPVAIMLWIRSVPAQEDRKLPDVDLNGARIHYSDTGGAGEAIVFSHGLLFSGAMFDEQVAHFRDRYRCIAFDHRGQGLSEVTRDGYDIETLTADAAALITHLGIAPCHFVGLSMGGFVGMRLAAGKPKLLKTLTLLDTSADPEPTGNGPRYRMLNLAARWIGLWAVVGRVMPIVFGKTFLNDLNRAKEKARWTKAISSNDRIGITRAVSGVIARDGCATLLGDIEMPVGIGVGDEDVATEPEKSEALHAAIRASELAVFVGAGHSSSIETPTLVNDLIERTIRRSD